MCEGFEEGHSSEGLNSTKSFILHLNVSPSTFHFSKGRESPYFAKALMW